ncbi:phage tail tape measure protein [Pseudomonas alloputida]|uniref:phage tail tape measure protein n=1 Tax=Pseudomonas alloputida TaxID=1940621 RepID=UPI001E44E0D8|nr:phage tail tape measure protein [Pseudomonas alloputida]MCE1059109.1 phage tail tape measure protein [Pseudomonas alloputida]
MASRLALSLVIGGAVASSVGAAFKTVENGIQKLEAKGNRAKVLKSTIGETVKLREEWKRAHDSGAAGADKLLRKLDSNLDALRKQGIEVGRLSREYQRLGREARAADLQLKGHQQLQAGKESLKSNIGKAVVATGAAAVPTMISANYQAVIRDIAIKADIVNKPEERQLTRTVIDTAKDTGMSRNDVADLVNQLVGAGMELDKALSYAPVAAKFAIGQGASGVDTASMIQALQQNAKISDPKVMQQALEAIAYQGQAGSFEASDMAKWFPQLLAGMEKNGITGLDAVTSLGSMLQVQMKTAGSSDEAANNFKNWMEKIGAGDVVKAYKDAGIDYQSSLNTGLQKGMNVIEASMALAMKYVEATDPAKAKKIEAAKAKIDNEVDPEKAKAALDALEKTLRTGDIFADMQVKAALTAYGQNRGLYEELKSDSLKASGILDKNLAERRETSAQQWAETVQAADDAMRSIGDAIRPATDMASKGLTAVARGITSLSDKFPAVVAGIAGTVAAILALKTASSAFKIGRGVLNIARGRGLEKMAGRAGRGDRTPIELPKTGSKVVDTGLGLLGKVFGATPKDAAPANDPLAGRDDTQRVFVVNADAFSGIGSSVTSSAPAAPTRGSRRSRRRARRREARQAAPARPGVKVAAPKSPLMKPAIPVAAPKVVTGVEELGRVARSVRGVTRLAKRLPGGNVVDAGAAAIDVAMNATSQDEKAEGYGGAAGSLAGTLAGAAAGAAIGSVVPVIGTAVGGAVGAVLGGMGGESLGGWLGKRWFGDEQPESAPKAEPESPAAPGEALRVTLAPSQKDKPIPKAAVVAPVVIDNREPVTKPMPAPPVPAPGDTVRNVAAPVLPDPKVSYDPLDPASKDPYQVPALTANKVRFPRARLVRPPAQPEAQPEAVPSVQEPPAKLGNTLRAVNVSAPAQPEPVTEPDPTPALQELPRLGDSLRAVATPTPAEPEVSYDPLDPASKDPYLVPALTASKVRFPGAPLVRPPAQPAPQPEAVPIAQEPPAKLGETVRAVTVSAPAQLEPVVEPEQAPALQELPRLGDTVKAVATPIPVEPEVLYDPLDPASKDPYLVPALTANKVRFPGAPLVRPTAQPDPVPEPVLQEAPKLGSSVRAVATPAPTEPPVSYDPRDPASKDPYLLPALTANKVRFPGAGLVPPQVQPQPASATPPVRLGETVREVPAKSVPVPVMIDSRERRPGADGVPPPAVPQLAALPAGFGEVVRDMVAKLAPVPPRMPELAQPAKAAMPVTVSAPKVDQAFSFSPNIRIDVQGDVKDPSQVVREIESSLRQLFEAWQREASARKASAQLFDQPHV